MPVLCLIRNFQCVFSGTAIDIYRVGFPGSQTGVTFDRVSEMVANLQLQLITFLDVLEAKAYSSIL